MQPFIWKYVASLTAAREIKSIIGLKLRPLSSSLRLLIRGAPMGLLIKPNAIFCPRNKSNQRKAQIAVPRMKTNIAGAVELLQQYRARQAPPVHS
jgi:hypothetical protein